MNKKTYTCVNLIIIILAVYFVIKRIAVFNIADFKTGVNNYYLIIAAFLCFIMVHFFKMLRFYIILIEQKIDFFRFMKVYVKITFVNMTLPFKSGELFRIYCFANETQNSKVGILSVIIDRFFDTCALLLILLPYDLIIGSTITPVTLLLIVFTVSIMFLYRVFMPIYIYLNRYLIVNGNGKNSIKLLHVIESGKTWYDYIKELIKGRSSLVLIFSCFGWIFEFIVLMSIQKLLGNDFGVNGFVNYINSIFGYGNTNLLNIYTSLSCIILAVITFIIYGCFYLGNKSR